MFLATVKIGVNARLQGENGMNWKGSGTIWILGFEFKLWTEVCFLLFMIRFIIGYRMMEYVMNLFKSLNQNVVYGILISRDKKLTFYETSSIY